MSMIKLAVKRPVTMIILVSVILILGFFTYNKLTVDLLPDMELPVAVVMTTYGGVGPEEVESGVTELLESALTMVSNVDTMQSISSAGQSTIIMQFKWGTDMDAAAIEIKDSIGFVEGFLPSGAEDPMIIKMDPTMMPIIQMGVSGQDLAQVQEIAEEVIEPRLSRIPEIASVIITGILWVKLLGGLNMYPKNIIAWFLSQSSQYHPWPFQPLGPMVGKDVYRFFPHTFCLLRWCRI